MAYGFNFRATSGYVTDSAGQTYSLGAVYPETRNGITFGWNKSLTGNSRDRSTSSPGAPELAGIIYWTNSTNNAPQATFKVTLPQAGDWIITAAFGDASSQQTHYVRFKDGGTTFSTISNVVTNAGQFADATGVVRTSASDWKSNAATLSRTFTSTTFEIEIGDLAFTAGNNTAISHLTLTYVPPASQLSGNVDLDAVAPAGTFADAGASTLGGNVDLDAVSPAGTLQAQGSSDLGGGVTLDAVAPAGTFAQQPGTVTVPALRNWSGTLQTSVTIPVVTVMSLATGAQVLALTDQTTHGTTGDLTLTSTSIITGVTYMVAGWNADGSSRFAAPITAT